MVNSFSLKTLLSEQDIQFISTNFGFQKYSNEELNEAFQNAFHDYILVSLSEMGESLEENKRLYSEANFHLQKASKLLLSTPHPAGKMSLRLTKMSNTLHKLIDGSLDISAQRATRFMEKNLARQLRSIWQANTSTSFYFGGDDSGKNPRDYLIFCFKCAGKQYPELEWFNQMDERIADVLIKQIKRH